MNDWSLNGMSQNQQSVTADWELVGNRSLIDGVSVKEPRPVLTRYGHLSEVWRADWKLDGQPVDQVFQATYVPGQLSAWHAHAATIDRIFVSVVTMKIVIYDARRSSPTFGQVNQFTIGAMRPAIIVIPPGVWHGVKNIGADCATLLNLVDRAYAYDAPDHWKVDPNSPEIPFRWDQV